MFGLTVLSNKAEQSACMDSDRMSLELLHCCTLPVLSSPLSLFILLII